jgi:hypothetical protein
VPTGCFDRRSYSYRNSPAQAGDRGKTLKMMLGTAMPAARSQGVSA